MLNSGARSGSLDGAMKLRFGRAALVALLFLGTQVAPGLHAAFDAGHDIHVCCTDGDEAIHLDACEVDHHAPPCPVCASGRAPVSASVEFGALALGPAPVPVLSTPVVVPVDPFHVETPDLRGPPA